MENIEKNLYQFYLKIGMSESVKHVRENGYDIVISGKEYWPQIIFNIDNSIEPKKLIARIATDFLNKRYTPFFIASNKYITREYSAILKENKIIPVKILRGMNLFSTQINNLLLSPGIQIIELKEHDHFVGFSNLVNTEIMASEMLFNPKLLNALKPDGEIKIFGLFIGKQLASTLLVFTETSNAGLYFIATKKEFQKKGYASILIRFVVNNLFEGGIKEVVLHANNFATGIYKKLGFTHQNNFVIYKMF